MRNVIRFGDLVRLSGRPETHTLWSGDPVKDRSFQKTIRQNRLLTIVHEPTSTRKPFGQIGYHPKGSATYLVFPRPLPKAPRSRVVGINFDLLDEPFVRPSATRPKASSVKRSNSKTSSPKSFAVRLRRSAITEQTISVIAPNQKAAKHQAMEHIRDDPPEITPAEVRTEILKVEPIS